MTVPVAICDLYERSGEIILRRYKPRQLVLCFITPCTARANTLNVFCLYSKNLTWRDMQHLVVRTSNPAHLSTNDWKTNGVGRRGESPSCCFSLRPSPFLAFLVCLLRSSYLSASMRSITLSLAAPISKELKISTDLIHLFTYNVNLVIGFLNWLRLLQHY